MSYTELSTVISYDCGTDTKFPTLPFLWKSLPRVQRRNCSVIGEEGYMGLFDGSGMS